MPYGELMIAPMRKELTQLGIEELRESGSVDTFLERASDRTAMIVVNSMCGCAAGSMRPAVAMAIDRAARPEVMGTVFAGQDIEATERAREYFQPHPPSSPAVALFKEGELVFMLPRERIQGRQPGEIAAELTKAFDEHCGTVTAEG